jgi:hypothetical protein
MTDHDVTMSQAMSDEGRITEPEAETIVPLGGPDEAVAGIAEEAVEGVPVLAEVRTLERASAGALPAVQAAAAVATGFVAGAATIVLVKRHGGRRSARLSRSAPRRAVDMLPIVGSRTFLVDIHLIGKPEE